MFVKKEATKRKKGSLPLYTIKIETKIIFVFVCYIYVDSFKPKCLIHLTLLFFVCRLYKTYRIG